MIDFDALPLYGVGERRPRVASLVEMFAEAAGSVPEAVAYVEGEARLSFGTIAQRVERFAAWLAERFEEGTVIGILIPNGAAFAVAYFAALRARLVPALLNPLHPPRRLAALLGEAEGRALIAAPPTRALGEAVRAEMETLALLEETEDTAARKALAARGEPGPDDPAVILFTGGTTGLPKAVAQTHRRLLIALRIVEYNWPTRRSGEVWLPIAPFTHVFGFLQGFLAPISARAMSVIPPRFQPELIVDLLDRYRVSVFGGGPAPVYAGVLAATNFSRADLSRLRVCPSGGAPVPVEIHRRWRECTGAEIHEGYGMTEMAPISGTTSLSGVRPGSVGPALPGIDIEIVDVETGTRLLPPGEKGEIRVRGPHMMEGYRNRPEETALVLREGYLYTGDIGFLDAEGFLHITDRKKDMILVKGFNVYPREVEEVLHAHPDVAQAGVIGLADARSGERVVAFVVPRSGATLDPATLARHCADHLAPYQCPAAIHVIEALPMTGAHKLDRLALRRLAEGAA